MPAYLLTCNAHIQRHIFCERIHMKHRVKEISSGYVKHFQRRLYGQVIRIAWIEPPLDALSFTRLIHFEYPSLQPVNTPQIINVSRGTLERQADGSRMVLTALEAFRWHRSPAYTALGNVFLLQYTAVAFCDTLRFYFPSPNVKLLKNTSKNGFCLQRTL